MEPLTPGGRWVGTEGRRGVRASPSAAIPPASSASAVEWLPLQRHPVFDRNRETGAALKVDATVSEITSGYNLAAWDSSCSRLYLWDPEGVCLHRISVRFRSPGGPASAEAASPSEFQTNIVLMRILVISSVIIFSMILPSIQISLLVHHISLNREGSSVLISGYGGVYVMYIHDRISSIGNTTVCRTVFVGSQAYLVENCTLRVLQVSWHPCSVTHLGVLSSDSLSKLYILTMLCRIYDLSSDIERQEQEYFLQPVEVGRCKNAASVCPVSFSLEESTCGIDLLLPSIFQVFILFSDGSVYILCPVAPFGSVFSLPFIKEIYEDALEFGQKSSNSKAVSNCRLALAWLEATFPELIDHTKERLNLPVLRAHSYAPVDASLSLQGPLRRVYHSKEFEDSETWVADCEGRAVTILYSSIGKDSILVIAWSSGQLQVDALADEVQPLWNMDSSPHLRVNSRGHIAQMGMICEPNSQEPHNIRFLQGNMSSNAADPVWSGNPPPYLGWLLWTWHYQRQPYITQCRFFRIRWSPRGSTVCMCPSVCPILSTCHGEASSPLLYGFVCIADSFGDSQVVVVTSVYECILLEMRGWKDMLPHFLDESVRPSIGPEDVAVIIIPDSTSLRSLSPESIEGRSTLHHYIKLFHENFVEYAHKVYVELKQHGDHLKAILGEQHARLQVVGESLSRLEDKQPRLTSRINRATEVYRIQERRLQSFKNLPGADRKPLSKAEREFKTQLEIQGRGTLCPGFVHRSPEREVRRCLHPSPGGPIQRLSQGRRNQALDSQRISQLKNVNKIKLIEQVLHSEEDDG
ncbi:unnamed protein product [Spirodela intermedia]|uniref:Uncharacterized protein n=1 Tax=Spirodela intermedia TaxID=51605 RepID=A0A7I8JH41_SPIIN|nr:unnamed protein product [Spirodela intermedia]CAA6669467.1 unnamed protein product [Spirodela intermedia]